MTRHRGEDAVRAAMFLAAGAMVAATTVPGHAQPKPAFPVDRDAPACPAAKIQPAFRNLDFSEGHAGERPPGWEPSDPACFLPPNDPNTVETVSGRLCYTGWHCAVVRSVLPNPIGDEVIRYISLLRAPHMDKGWGMFQVVDATPDRRKTLIFRAAMKADVPSGSGARLFVRIHRQDGSTSFFDNMGQFPVRSSAWHFYEIPAYVGQDDSDVEFGIQLIGQGEAWIDHITVGPRDGAK
jgi:hypothetical protein